MHQTGHGTEGWCIHARFKLMSFDSDSFPNRVPLLTSEIVLCSCYLPKWRGRATQAAERVSKAGISSLCGYDFRSNVNGLNKASD